VLQIDMMKSQPRRGKL